MSKRKPSKKSSVVKKNPAVGSGGKRAVPRGTSRTVRPPKPTRPPAPVAAKLAAMAAGGHDIEIIARGCLLHGSHVLLCRNVKHGYCYLPGGHVEFGESASAAVAREFLEESGLRVLVRDLALVSEGAFPTKKRWHHEINLVFHVEQQGASELHRKSKPGTRTTHDLPPTIKSREDWIDFTWVELAAIPETDIRPIAAKAWLATLGGPVTQGIEWVSEMSS